MEQYDQLHDPDSQAYIAELRAMDPEAFIAHLTELREKRETDGDGSNHRMLDRIQTAYFEKLYTDPNHHAGRESRFYFCQEMALVVDTESGLGKSLLNTIRTLRHEDPEDARFIVQCNGLIMDFYTPENAECWEDCQRENMAVYDRLNDFPETQLEICSYVVSDNAIMCSTPNEYDHFALHWQRLMQTLSHVERDPETREETAPPKALPEMLLGQCNIVMMNDVYIPQFVLDTVEKVAEESIMRYANDLRKAEATIGKKAEEKYKENIKLGMNAKKPVSKTDHTSAWHSTVWNTVRWNDVDTKNVKFWGGFWAQNTMIKLARISPKTGPLLNEEMHGTEETHKWTQSLFAAVKYSSTLHFIKKQEQDHAKNPQSEQNQKFLAELNGDYDSISNSQGTMPNRFSALYKTAETFAKDHTGLLDQIRENSEKNILKLNPDMSDDKRSNKEKALRDDMHNRMDHTSKYFTLYYQMFVNLMAPEFLNESQEPMNAAKLVRRKAYLHAAIMKNTPVDSVLGHYATQQHTMLTRLCLPTVDDTAQKERAMAPAERAQFSANGDAAEMLKHIKGKTPSLKRHFDLN